MFRYVLALTMCAVALQAADKTEWTPLFDGKSTKGWEPRAKVECFCCHAGFLQQISVGWAFLSKQYCLKVTVEHRCFLSRLIAYFSTFTPLIEHLWKITVGWRVFKNIFFLKYR